MIVPFLDLSASYQELKDEIDEAILRVASSGRYILGSEVEEFEEQFAQFCNANYAVGVGNGLDALVLALKALEIGQGDDVLVPSNTFIATWLAVTCVGARPVPVDPDPLTFNLDPTRLSRAITPRTKAVIVVHLYGQPADLEAINKFARKHGLAVIEDAAQAHGAMYKGEVIGSHSDLVCWSFYPGKNLGAMGDGGALTTDNDYLQQRVKLLRNYGSREKYINEAQGVNSRLDPIQAAVLGVKLKYLKEWNARRQSVSERYRRELRLDDLALPVVPEWATPAWHLFVVKTQKRNLLQTHLNKRGVQTIIHYPIPPHAQRAYEHLVIDRSTVAIAERLAHEVISLPISPHISDYEIETVIEAINSFS